MASFHPSPDDSQGGRGLWGDSLKGSGWWTSRFHGCTVTESWELWVTPSLVESEEHPECPWAEESLYPPAILRTPMSGDKGFCPFLPVDRDPLSLQAAKEGAKATFSRQSGRWKKMWCLLIIYAACLLKMSDIHIHTPYKIFLSLYDINFLVSGRITPLWPLGA